MALSFVSCADGGTPPGTVDPCDDSDDEDCNEDEEEKKPGKEDENTPPDTEFDCKESNRGRCVSLKTLAVCEKDGNGDYLEREIQCDDIFQDGVCNDDAANARCEVPIGAQCRITDDQGRTITARCKKSGTKGVGCIANGPNDEFFCVEGVPNCPQQAGGCTTGQRYLAQSCNDGQVLGFDCGEMGGICSGKACRQLPVGAECETDLRQTIHTFICDDGSYKEKLKCVGETDLSPYGTCQPR